MIGVRLVVHHKDQLIFPCSQYLIYVHHDIGIHLKHPEWTIQPSDSSLPVNDQEDMAVKILVFHSNGVNGQSVENLSEERAGRRYQPGNIFLHFSNHKVLSEKEKGA